MAEIDIHRLCFDLSVTDQDTARDVQNRVSAAFDRIAAELEAALEGYDDPQTFLAIERLELHLQSLDLSHLEEDLLTELRRALEEQMVERITAPKRRDETVSQPFQRQTLAAREIDIVRHFLRTGLALDQTTDLHVTRDRLRRAFYQHGELVTWFIGQQGGDAHLLDRVLYHLGDHELHALILGQTFIEVSRLRQLLTVVSALPRPRNQPWTSETIRRTVWHALFTQKSLGLTQFEAAPFVTTVAGLTSLAPAQVKAALLEQGGIAYWDITPEQASSVPTPVSPDDDTSKPSPEEPSASQASTPEEPPRDETDQGDVIPPLTEDRLTDGEPSVEPTALTRDETKDRAAEAEIVTDEPMAEGHDRSSGDTPPADEGVTERFEPEEQRTIGPQNLETLQEQQPSAADVEDGIQDECVTPIEDETRERADIDVAKPEEADTQILSESRGDMPSTPEPEDGDAIGPDIDDQTPTPHVEEQRPAISVDSSLSAAPDTMAGSVAERTSSDRPFDRHAIPDEVIPSPTLPDVIYLHNAGIVLLAPFLGHFFAALDLLAEGRFIDEEKQKRAAVLLHYLYPGQEISEDALVLNKLLCGLELTEPVPLHQALADDERAEIQDLLQAVVQHWTALKNTSAAAFQHNFLLRQARLSRKAEHWHLHIKRESIDVLLETLPWSIALVKHPWMPKRIEVEW